MTEQIQIRADLDQWERLQRAITTALSPLVRDLTLHMCRRDDTAAELLDAYADRLISALDSQDTREDLDILLTDMKYAANRLRGVDPKQEDR